ncbi:MULTISPECIES: hypothetical protein [unclassified Cellvibrio]|uniref:hypothetical protein n=1 Tax=unclassified Cellvibrio TaxID=2624793 RepID=UPI001248CE8B|nr:MULTISPECIES: hypothetical protein [unclassified Cellvibrio]QEY11820.1 hypothetical protein D0B88_05760 [Cellvibrio sp. KY-YJ-3]UUA72007.1 hypothetical protein NNX04_16500 [Cellvibrio sp. QJXJ]
MPTRRTGNFNVAEVVLERTKAKLATFLSEEEMARTQIRLENGKLSFNADKSILEKITSKFGEPASSE